MLEFLVYVYQDEEGGWNGQMPVPDPAIRLYTCGDSPEEVVSRSVDLANIWVAHCWESGRDVSQCDLVVAGCPQRVGPSLRVQAAWMIRQLRIAKGMTQEEAAHLAGMNQQAYSKLENPRKSNATMSTLDRIARAFGKVVHMEAIAV